MSWTTRWREANRRGHIFASVGGAFLIAQFVLLFFIGRGYVPALRYLGFALWAAGCILAWAPIIVFHRSGGVPSGKSFVQTSRLVTAGIYSIVRHPQYLSYFLFAFALALIGQHWAIALLGAAGSAVYSVGLKGVDDSNIEKFGDEYRRYKREVPGYNILLGVVRKLRRRARLTCVECDAGKLGQSSITERCQGAARLGREVPVARFQFPVEGPGQRRTLSEVRRTNADSRRRAACSLRSARRRREVEGQQ